MYLAALRTINEVWLLMFTGVWHTPVGDHLIEENTERPDVGLDGEMLVKCCLGRRPLDRELRLCNHKAVT